MISTAMKYNTQDIIEELATVGYESMFADNWGDLPDGNIEKALWRKIALNMLTKLWELYRLDKPT